MWIIPEFTIEDVTDNKYLIRLFGVLALLLSPIVIPIAIVCMYFTEIWFTVKFTVYEYFIQVWEYITWRSK